MNGLVQFILPVKGLGLGIHMYTFYIDHSFFQHFEHSPIQDSDIDLWLTLDKRVDMFVLDFEFEGTVETQCDRCLVDIHLPVEGEGQIIVKLSEEERPEEDAEIVFIHPDEATQLDVSRYAYEFICLAMPLIKVYDCEDDEPPPCDQTMLAHLTPRADPPDDQGEEAGGDNPIWEELKKKLE